MISADNFVNRPISIALFTLIFSVGSGWVRDRLVHQTTETSLGIRIQHLEEISHENVQRGEFRATMDGQRGEFKSTLDGILRELERINAKLDR